MIASYIIASFALDLRTQTNKWGLKIKRQESWYQKSLPVFQTKPLRQRSKFVCAKVEEKRAV